MEREMERGIDRERCRERNEQREGERGREGGVRWRMKGRDSWVNKTLVDLSKVIDLY